MAKRTPLYDVHVAAGARMIEFGGWEMPVQYSGVLEEHRAVRSNAGIFDLSHMGELLVSGPDALPALQALTTNDLSLLQIGQAQYSLLCLPTGGVVDDIVIYRRPNDYMVVVNAANIAKDAAWLTSHLSGQVILENRSAETALIAVQGPAAAKIVEAVAGVKLDHLYAFEWTTAKIAGVEAVLARTGYTGEDGFELFLPTSAAQAVWHMLMEEGSPLGMVPVGLGARDTLRLEARLSLYGNDITESTTPLEAGLGYFVKLDKGEFVGRTALLAQKEQGLRRRLVGFVVKERGIPRHGYRLLAPDNTTIGEVTSGSFSPTLGKDIGLGYVTIEHASPGSQIQVDIRGKGRAAEVVQGRFVEARTRRRI